MHHRGKRQVSRFIGLALTAGLVLTGGALAAEVSIGSVTAGTLNVRAKPTTESSIVEKLSNGDQVLVLSQEQNWASIRIDNVEGYVSLDYITLTHTADVSLGTGTVTGSTVNLRSAPNTDAAIVAQLGKGKQVDVLGIQDSWYSVSLEGVKGYIHPDYLELSQTASVSRSGVSGSEDSTGEVTVVDGTDASAVKRQEIVDYAKTFLGCKYVYGTSNGKTFDCSGFTSYVYKHFGYSLNRSSADQLQNGTKVEKADLKTGDLVFFRDTSISKRAASHVGIYISGGNFIHASSRGSDVKYNNLSDSYYSKYYIGARRIIQ